VLYVLEDVWAEDDTESELRLPSPAPLLIVFRGFHTPFGGACFSELLHSRDPAWLFRKGKAFLSIFSPGRVVSSLSTTSYVFHVGRAVESTIKAVQDMEASEEEEERWWNSQANPCTPSV
jgi:hypothetical protein